MTAYQLTPAAEADLEAIWNYTDRVWGIEQAHRYIEGLADTFGVLAETPTLARERHEFQPPVRIHPHAHHLIVYLTTESGVLIVRILHESMDVDAQLED